MPTANTLGVLANSKPVVLTVQTFQDVVVPSSVEREVPRTERLACASVLCGFLLLTCTALAAWLVS